MTAYQHAIHWHTTNIGKANTSLRLKAYFQKREKGETYFWQHNCWIGVSYITCLQCLRALRAFAQHDCWIGVCYITCLQCLRALHAFALFAPSRLTSLRAFVPSRLTYLRALRAFVPYVLWLRALRPLSALLTHALLNVMKSFIKGNFNVLKRNLKGAVKFKWKKLLINIYLNLMCKFKFIIYKGGSRINFRVLQNFTKRIERRNDEICRKIIDSARSKKVQFWLQ